MFFFRGFCAVQRLFLRAGAAALILLPLTGHASFFETQAAQLKIWEQEISYRPYTDNADFETVSRTSEGWIRQSDTPFATPSGPFQLWARVDLPNVEKPRRVLLDTSPWDRVEFFIVRDGKLVSREIAGTLVPPAQRTFTVTMTPLFSHSGFVPVELLLGTHNTVFARLSTSQKFRPIKWLRFYLWDAEQVLANEREDRIFQGVFFGLMLALLIYNLAVFVALREPSFIYYVLLLGGTVLIWASLYGLTSEYLWPNHPAVEFYLLWLVTGPTVFSAVYFLRHYIETRRTVPLGDVILRWIAIAALAVTPFSLLIARYDALVALEILAAPVFACFWVAVAVTLIALRRGHPAAPIFLAAIACSITGAMIQSAETAQWIPASDFTARSAQLGTIGLGIILSIGLGFRFRHMRDELAGQKVAEAERQSAHEREKRELIERQSHDLEAKVRERTAELAVAREKSEALLANILPQAIIDELQKNGTTEPRRHEEVSILFSDLCGFTEAVAAIPPKRLVQELDELFRAFDEISAEHGLEKIKTISDAYMAASGLPLPTADHAVRCVRAGLALTQFIRHRNDTSAIKWDLRVGIHSGAVVAGIVGKNKYAYDVWGDTVNLASRIESASERNCVNISAYTYDLVRDEFECEYRTKLVAKGKGEIDMYFVQRAKNGD
jgi:class 3 adenylate cyclase